MKRNNGFTLLEIMLVIIVMGVLASIAVPNITWGSKEDKIAEESQRFKAIFDIASEYAMINNFELGLIIKDNNYRFVAFDGQRWGSFEPEKYFEASDLEKGFELELELEGLPWAENNLLNEVSFQVEEDDDNEEKEMLSPQVYILSSGDITPFRLTFTIEEEIDFGSQAQVYYQVTGDFTAPLTVKGPLETLQ
jgi:general secretion pathway protein H